jgi:hypothetical protein
VISRLEKKSTIQTEHVLKRKEKLAFLNDTISGKDCELAAKSSKLAALNRKVSETTTTLCNLQKKVKAAKALARYHDNNNPSDIDAEVDNVGYLCYTIERACNHLKGKHASTKAKLLMEAVSCGQLFKGEAASAFSDVVKARVRELFRPWKLVKAGDVSSAGSFKTSTINALREIIDGNNENLFPSATTVNHSWSLLDKYAAERIGYERKLTPYGEVYFINFEAALCLLLKASTLDTLATTTSVKIALTVDGTDLFNDQTHVSTGIKITDERGIHPVTKQPLLVMEDNADPTFVKVQSSELCCITIIADARDDKHLYEGVFNDYYKWGDLLRTEGLAESPFGPKLMPFCVTHNTDLKAAWYLSNRGGGCKNKLFLPLMRVYKKPVNIFLY